MKRFSVIKPNGELDTIAIADEPLNELWIDAGLVPEYPARWDFAEKQFVAIESDDAPIDLVSSLMTKYAFLKRWTDEEAIAIDIAGIDNPGASMEDRVKAAFLRRQRDLQSNAEYINLKDKKTIDGVTQIMQFLQSIGVVKDAEARTREFLEAPLSDKEKFTGKS